MGLLLPVYNFNPGGKYVAKAEPDAYVWFISGAQQLDTAPYSMSCAARIYASKSDYLAGNPPLEVLNLNFDNQSDMAQLVYGPLDPAWTPPTAPNPLLGGAIGPLQELKKQTAFLVRNDAVFGQVGATWD